MRDFLKQLLASLVALLMVAVVAGLVLLLVVAMGLAGSRPDVPKQAVLTVDFSQQVTDRGGLPKPLELLQGGGRNPLAAHEIAATLRHAAQDERIKGVLLHGDVSVPLMLLSEIRESVEALRAAGKPVVAYYGSYGERHLYLASAASELWMEPLGLLIFDGLAIEIPYFGEAFEKYGIEVQVTRVGKYKSAVEPLTQRTMSPENREQLQGLLGELQNELIDTIARGRTLPREELTALLTFKGLVPAGEAVERGLVTRAAPFGELVTRLAELAPAKGDEGGFAQVDLLAYARAVREQLEPGSGPGVTVVLAEGEIIDGDSDEVIGGDSLARELRRARLDDKTKAVVLRVNSPGGSATASDVIRSEVRALRAAGKPVVVSMADVAASGGYWISANADAIVAHPGTITGSIGVIGMLPNVEKLLSGWGVKGEVVSTGPYANWQSLLQHKSAPQIAAMQDLVDRIYEKFLELVSEGRSLTRDSVHEIAQGRVWTGRRAKQLGLVDELGGLDTALALARAKAGLPADAPVRYPREEPELLQQLIEAVLERERSHELTRVLEPLRPALAALERAQRLAGGSGVIARLPFDVVIR